MEDNKVAMLLEDIQSQFRVFGEGLAGIWESNEKIHKRLGRLEAGQERLDVKVLAIDHKLEEHKEETKANFDKIETGQKEFRQEVNACFNKIDERFDKMDIRFDKMDIRFDKMDTCFDNLECIVTRHATILQR